MSTSLLYHAFSVRGYEYVRTDDQGGAVIFTIRQERKTLRCEDCGWRDVSALWNHLPRHRGPLLRGNQ
jgi:hypothetical protein